MDALVNKIHALISDVRMTDIDLDYLAFRLVYESPRMLFWRVYNLGKAIVKHGDTLIAEEYNGNRN